FSGCVILFRIDSTLSLATLTIMPLPGFISAFTPIMEGLNENIPLLPRYVKESVVKQIVSGEIVPSDVGSLCQIASDSGSTPRHTQIEFLKNTRTASTNTASAVTGPSAFVGYIFDVPLTKLGMFGSLK